MKYFIDTEFNEYKRKPFIGKPIDTIELISIGIVSEDGREYYAISKDFNIRKAWNNEWLRENVIKSIHNELALKENNSMHEAEDWFTYNSLFTLLKKYGKSNKQIAEEVKLFTSKHLLDNSLKDKNGRTINQIEADATLKQFYGYYSDYDWVLFCWLFGRMIDLPKGFPMYCIDLKQILDEKIKTSDKLGKGVYQSKTGDTENIYIDITKHPDYPEQTNEHNALADAKWDFELYKFLQTL